MAEAYPLRTVVSTKGQVILPKAIRDQRRWHAGTRLTVEDTPEGVLLRPEPLFPRTSVNQVAGMLKPLYRPQKRSKTWIRRLPTRFWNVMRAVDTNVVVRYLVADDEDRFRRVCRLFENYDVSIATTVLLETE